MEAKCTCGTEFEFKPETETVKGVDVQYAECTCGKRYLISVQDKEVRDRIEKTNQLLKRYQNKAEPYHKRKKAWDKKQRFDKATRVIMKSKENEYREIVDYVIQGRS